MIRSYSRADINEAQSVLVEIPDLSFSEKTVAGDFTENMEMLASLTDGTISQPKTLEDYRKLLRSLPADLDQKTGKALLKDYRELCKRAYFENNSSYVDNYLKDYDVAYISRYTPMVLLSLTLSDVYEVAKMPGVKQISLAADAALHDETDESSVAFYSSSVEQALELTYSYNQKMLDMTHINGLHSGMGLSGEGISVGTVDFSGVEAEYVDALDIYHNEISETATLSRRRHSTDVASIIRQVAPECKLYCMSNNHRSNVIAVEQLVDMGVNIVSLSYSDYRYSASAPTYSTNARWLDAVCDNACLTAVVASGNNNMVSDWGISYNVITVGNVMMNGVLADSSSYTPSSATGIPYKPDICAPGNDVMSLTEQTVVSGTSYATPVVAGICALLMEQEGSLIYRPEIVKAIITSGVNTSYTDGEGNTYSFARNVPQLLTGNYEKYGAGIIDFERAMNIVLRNYCESSFIAANTQEIIKFPVRMVAGKTYRVSMTYLRPASGEETVTDFTDLDVTLQNAKGVYCAGSTTSKSNVEIFEYTPTVTGDYSIWVHNVSRSDKNIFFGVAWDYYS